ncbi:hypothetical protein A176_000663 [Myxococcus hansupus]|uniref:Uncharacterized protein n=1 Tax=Pseudomyxococcus hansupus TaxID=1297742 RepID=A0A0H4WK61_9BACT|nr:hypothetical protein A176_000663 [Myxococcus hansupus]
MGPRTTRKHPPRSCHRDSLRGAFSQSQARPRETRETHQSRIWLEATAVAVRRAIALRAAHVRRRLTSAIDAGRPTQPFLPRVGEVGADRVTRARARAPLTGQPLLRAPELLDGVGLVATARGEPQHTQTRHNEKSQHENLQT